MKCDYKLLPTKLSPERKLRYLATYMVEYIDAWPNKIKPFSNWLDSVLQKKVNRGNHNMIEQHRKICRYCSREFIENYIDKTKDHLVPLSKGGFDIQENRVPCCHECNQWKSDKTLEFWMNEIKRLIKKERPTPSYDLNRLGRMAYNIKNLITYKKENISKISMYKQ